MKTSFIAISAFIFFISGCQQERKVDNNSNPPTDTQNKPALLMFETVDQNGDGFVRMTSNCADAFQAFSVRLTWSGGSSVETLKGAPEIRYNLSRDSKVTCSDTHQGENGSATCDCHCGQGFRVVASTLDPTGSSDRSKLDSVLSCLKIEAVAE